jgi:hypothetical protein
VSATAASKRTPAVFCQAPSSWMSIVTAWPRDCSGTKKLHSSTQRLDA